MVICMDYGLIVKAEYNVMRENAVNRSSKAKIFAFLHTFTYSHTHTQGPNAKVKMGIKIK